MKVINRSCFESISVLRLSRVNLQLARTWIGSTEKLKDAEQSLIFLKRCKRCSILPSCVRSSIRPPSPPPPPSIRNDLSCSRLLRNTGFRILGMLIRSQYISTLKIQCSRASTDLRSDVAHTLAPIVERAAIEAKQSKKTNFRRKFDQLANQFQQNRNQQAVDLSTPKIDASPRLTILDDIKIDEHAKSTLARGPGFAVTPKITVESLQKTVQTEVAAVAYNLRRQAVINDFSLSAAVPKLASDQHNQQSVTPTRPNACAENTPTATSTDILSPGENGSPLIGVMPHIPFERRRRAPLKRNKMLEKSIQGLQRALDILVSRKLPKMSSNLTRQEHQAITQLRKQADITIVRSDKGGELVVMKTSTLHDLTMEHLGDDLTYKKLPKDPTEKLHKEVNSSLQSILMVSGYPKVFTDRFKTPAPAVIQRFYALPKTHKPNLKIRPIVSGSGGIFDRMGWLLQNILKPLLTKVSAHITSTKQLIQRLDSTLANLLVGKIHISFDIRALHTNIDVPEAINTVTARTSRSTTTAIARQISRR